jgi:Polyketide cyclase / dehydrase and lipid transport
MTQTVSVTRHIRRPPAEVGPFVMDSHNLIPAVSALGRCQYIGGADDGELWDVFLDVATIHLGGRVLVTHPEPLRLCWRSLRGTRHSFDAVVDADDTGSKLTLTLTFTSPGFVTRRLSELFGRGVVSSHLQAAAEELRHRLEFEQ